MVVSLVPVVSVVPVVVPDVAEVSVAGFGFELLLVGGFPGRGGSRLVAVATLPPPFGATAVEVTAVVVLLTVVCVAPAIVPAVPGIGGGTAETV